MDGVKGRARLRIPARASIWYIVSSALARSVSVVGTPIFTRLLSAGEYGAFPQYMTFFSLFSVVVTLELSGGVILRGLQKFDKRRDEFISCATGLIFVVWAVFSLLFFTFFGIFGDFTGLGKQLFAVMLVHILLNSVAAVYTAEARFSYKYRAVAFINIITSLLSPTISILLITGLSLGGEGRIYAALLTAGIIAIPLLFIIFGRSQRVYDGEIWRFLLRFSLPLLPHYLSAAVIIRVGEVALARIHGSEALAKYSVAMSVGLSLTVITNGLLSALSPWMLRRVRAGEIEKSRSVLLLATAGLSLVTLLILAIVPETILIVAPPEYHDCLFAVYPLALSVVPTFLSNAVVAGEMYFERSGMTSLPTVIAATVTVLFTLIFSRFIDYRMVAVFVPIAYVITCVLNCVIFYRLSKKVPIVWGKTLLLYVFTVVYAFLIFAFRESISIRILLTVPLIFPLIYAGRELYSIIKEN